jgi:hypothetical protein
MTGFTTNGYIEALEDRIGMLKEIIKIKDHKIAEMEVNANPATSRMALVFEEPDEKMLIAAANALMTFKDLEQTPYSEIARKVWKAMLEASQ